jgi:nitroreductase
MFDYQSPITELIERRVSHRFYQPKAFPGEVKDKLDAYLSKLKEGPLGTRIRFVSVAATDEDRSALRGLGTYGFIRGNTGFIVGAMSPSDTGLEDYGYALEQVVLFATDLGMGTCWLGGSFTRSTFAAYLRAKRPERIPAVLAIGVIDGVPPAPHRRRLPWENLFYENDFQTPLTPAAAGQYASILELVRLGPSASNKQPWRIVRWGDKWHFFLQRTQGYRKNLVTLILRIEDIQRVDIGIAMCHFALSAHQAEISGRWMIENPGIDLVDNSMEYRVTWQNE